MTRSVNLPVLALLTAVAAHADFSYTTTTRTSGSAPAQTTKQYLKGRKMKLESAAGAVVIDGDRGTITTIDNKQKSYSVRKIGADKAGRVAAAKVSSKTAVRETGARKKINGYDAREVSLTMDLGVAAQGKTVNMQLEADVWLSSDVPGARELEAFKRKNGPLMTFGQAHSDIERVMLDLQEKLSRMNGLPVLQVTKINMVLNATQVPQPSAPVPMPMITSETSGFSTDAIPDSIFEVPAGYRPIAAVHR